MNSEQFSYWLQGYAEICGSEPTAEQWHIIKDHLQLVFRKETPSYPSQVPNRYVDAKDYVIFQSPKYGTSVIC